MESSQISGRSIAVRRKWKTAGGEVPPGPCDETRE